MAKLVLYCAVVLVASVAAQLNVGNATAPGTNMTKRNSTITIAETTTTTTPRTNVTKNSTTPHRNVGNATAPNTNLTKKNSTMRATTEATTTTTTTTIPRTNVTKKNSTTSHRNVGNATAPNANLTKKSSTIVTTTTTTTMPGKNMTKNNSTASHPVVGNATAPKANLTKKNSTTTAKITTSTTSTTPATLQHHSIVETRLGMNFGISNPTSFNKMSMVGAVANASGISSADVALVFKKITVDVVYTLSQIINETSATQAVATANSVSIGQVAVQITSTRRLGQGSKTASGRRLAATVTATITVPNVTQAKAVHSSSSNNVALQSALAGQGVAVSVPTISVAPKIQAQVEVTIKTGSSQAGSLSTQQLASVASQLGGTVAVTSFNILTVTATTTNASTSTTTATITTTIAGNSNTHTTTTRILPVDAVGIAATLCAKPILVLFALASVWHTL